MNTLTDFLTRHVLALPLILQELIKDGFEALNQLNLLEVTLELIDSHHWNRRYFLINLGSTASIFEIPAVVHLVEVCEKLSHLFADKKVAEDVDLEMGPNLIQGHHELMMVFAETALRAQPLGDVFVDEELDVLAHVLVDLYFLLDGRLALLCEVVDESAWGKAYPLSLLWSVWMEVLSFSKRAIRTFFMKSNPSLMPLRYCCAF